MTHVCSDSMWWHGGKSWGVKLKHTKLSIVGDAGEDRDLDVRLREFDVDQVDLMPDVLHQHGNWYFVDWVGEATGGQNVKLHHVIFKGMIGKLTLAPEGLQMEVGQWYIVDGEPKQVPPPPSVPSFSLVESDEFRLEGGEVEEF